MYPYMKTLTYFLTVICLFFTVTVMAQDDQFKMKFNAFGAIVAGSPFGENVNGRAANLFSTYGDANYPTGMHTGFILPGIDLLNTVTVKDNFKVQTEVNIEGNRGADGGATDFEIERMFVEYKFSDA